MKEKMHELYSELKGTRTVNGQLIVQGFEVAEYEDLYYYLLEVLTPYFKGDYHNWYKGVALQYKRYRQATNRRYDFNCPQHELDVDEQTTQEQLALLKFFIYRKAGRGKTPYA